MAVIITNGSGTTLSDANAFWTVAAKNLSCFPLSTTTPYQSLSAWRYINFTSTDTGAFQGCVLALLNISTLTNIDIKVFLEQSYTATTPIASPGVVTTIGHNFIDGQLVSFTTTGALPTGIAVRTQYYVINSNIGAGTFQISATLGGPVINFTGTQSGVHTIGITRAQQTMTSSEIWTYAATSYNRMGLYLVDFRNFDKSPNLTITSNGWRLRCGVTNGTGAWNIMNGADNTNPFFAVYTDTTATFTDNDTVIIANPTEIDTSFTLGSVLGVGDTAVGVAGIVCANLTTIDPDDISLLTCINPASAYTMTLKGALVLGSHSGFRVGTSTSAITAANQFTILCDAPTVGTTRGCLRMPSGGNASGSYDYSCKPSLFLYSEYPNIIRTYLTEQANIGASSIKVNDDMSSLWSVGERISAPGKQDIIGQGSVVTHTIIAFGVNDITPIMTADNLPAPYVASASAFYTTYSPYKAFDGVLGNSTQGWMVATTTNSWLKLDYNSAKTVVRYRLWNAQDATTKGRAPKDWTFEGSNDDATWTVLDTQINITNWDSYNHYILASPSSYRYYRINITSNNGGATYTGIIDFKMFEAAVDNKSIMLDSNLLTANRLVDGSVYHLNDKNFGIHYYDTVSLNVNKIGAFSNFNIEGVFFNNVSLYPVYLSSYYYPSDDISYLQKMTVKNIFSYQEGGANYFWSIYLQRVCQLGMDVENVYGYRMSPISGMQGFSNTFLKSGTINIYNHRTTCGQGTPSFTYNGKSKLIVDTLNIENQGSNHGIYWSSVSKSYIKNAYLWGIVNSTSITSPTGALSFIESVTGAIFENIYIDNCSVAFNMYPNNVTFNVKLINYQAGTIKANTYDYNIAAAVYGDILFTNSSGFLVPAVYPDLTETVEGTKIKFVDYSGTTHNDFILSTYGNYYRTGDGLADTTVHTAGSGKYAMKMCPTDASNEHYWDFNIPTGPISGKTMVVSVWVKINDAAYYAGTHTNPTLEITYDEVTTVSAVASDSTDWQLLVVSFTPTTDYGEVGFKIFGSSDAATEAERCFYVDDISVFYPPGVSLNLGGMDLWADALPITPPISTSVNANDVWSVLPSTFTAGSIGELLADALGQVDGLDYNDIMKIIVAVLAGKTNINVIAPGQATTQYRNLTDTIDRVDATMNGSERTSVGLDLS